MDAAGRAEKELGAVLQVVKKTSKDYALEDDPPPCPSVMVDGELIAEGLVTYEALEAALQSGGAGQQGAS
jgi:predicted thioredoxin/glutaredoxin